VESFVDNIVNEQRSRVQDVLERFSRALLKEGRVHQNTIDMVSDMVIEYEKMDIIGDDKFLGILKEMKTRLVDKYKSKDLRRNKDLRKKIADEVSMLACMAADRTVISQLATNYRQKINL
jgi:hypothetical protein